MKMKKILTFGLNFWSIWACVRHSRVNISQLNIDIFTEWTPIDGLTEWLTYDLCKVDFKKDVNLFWLLYDFLKTFVDILETSEGRPTKWGWRRRGQSIRCGWRRKSCCPRSLLFSLSLALPVSTWGCAPLALRAMLRYCLFVCSYWNLLHFSSISIIV